MVLNLITLKIRPFLPGLGWKKKGLPELAIIKENVTTKKIGLNKSKPIIAARKLQTGLKIEL
jgi:hypothetical protein